MCHLACRSLPAYQVVLYEKHGMAIARLIDGVGWQVRGVHRGRGASRARFSQVSEIVDNVLYWALVFGRAHGIGTAGIF